MFDVDNHTASNMDVYKSHNQEMMSYEDRVSEENIKQQKLRRQREVNDYLTKRREPVQIRKLSILEDDAFRIKVHVVIAIVLGILYFQYRVAPKLKNKYGYIGKDIERNERLAKLPIMYREDGEIQHEEDLAHLTTGNDTLFLKSQLAPNDAD